MATVWQGPHYIAILAASALAFGGGYLLAGRSRAPATAAPATNTTNEVEPAGIPGFGNEQAPRGRPDENELIARNAEPAEGSAAPQGNASRPQSEERRARPPREEREDKPPPSELEDDLDSDPGGW